jgi:hypothetical protein
MSGSSWPPPPRGVTLQSLLAASQPRKRNYIHLTIFARATISDETFDTLKAFINEIGEDWLKYARESWIIYTYETPESLYKKLLARIPDLATYTILTFPFDPNGQKSGQMEKWVWEWMNRKR